MDLKAVKIAVDQLAEEKGVSAQKILEAIESSIAAAYKREYAKRTEIIRSKFDLKTGELKFWQIKTLVDENTVKMEEEVPDAETPPVPPPKSREETFSRRGESRFAETEDKLPRYNPDRHILLEEAKKIKPDAALGEELEFPLETHEEFGRIAAQTAKQVVLQKIREAEQESVRSEFQDKEGQIVSGIVQRFDRGNIFIDLGRAIGVMFYNETIPGEHYRAGERLRFYVLAVQQSDRRLPGIILSRSHPKFVIKMFELEVPEIAEGIVEIKAIAREPGSRTKVAVASNDENIDPVGSCVGQRGTRVMAVTNELGQEKLDIVQWDEEPEKFVANSLSPAKVKLVEILPRREARVLVAEDQLSLAIGKSGQNVRLAAKLTGWKIDVRSQSRPEEKQEGGVAVAEEEIFMPEKETAPDELPISKEDIESLNKDSGGGSAGENREGKERKPDKEKTKSAKTRSKKTK